MPTATPRTPRRPLVRPSAIAAVLVALALGAAACGGDDDDDTTGATGGADAAAETVDIAATEFRFNPDNPTVKPGEVTFDLENEGQVEHNIELEGPNGEQEIEMNVEPGSSGELTVDLDEPGTYEFYCPVGNHRELGMVGEVAVKG